MSARAWTVEPSVSLRLTATDNRRLQSSKEADVITEGTAGLRISSNAGVIRGFLDYSLLGTAYARDSDLSDVSHRLGAAATAELISGFAFVDAAASYARQAVSAFGVQSAPTLAPTGNQTDAATVSITPRIRGRLAPTVRYDGRVSFAATRAKDTDAGDVDSGHALLSLDGDTAGSPMRWRALAQYDTTDYVAGRRTFDSRLKGSVGYLFTRELKLGVSVGAERTNLRILDGETLSTAGLEAEWTPTERTLLAASIEKRFFGTGHSVQLSHRTPRTAWTVADTRDVSSATQPGTAAFGSAYDLYFRQFASEEPDPIKRDLRVRNYMQTNNIDPNAPVLGGFLAQAATLTRTQSASFGLVGVRNSVTLRAARTRSQRVDEIVSVNDDLNRSSIVKQQGLWLEGAHRLTPTSALTATAGYQRTQGDADAQGSTLKSFALGWAAPLGPRSTVALGARHAVFDSLVASYKENAIFGALRYAF